MNEKDLFDFDYSLYLEHLAVCQNNTVRCVAEATCISENQIDQLVSVNESFIDTVKNVVNRIIEAVKKQFAKFTETMTGLFTSDIKWLKDPKVKKVILNNPWKEREPFDMTEYHEENLDKFLIKPFEFNNFKQVTTAENTEAEFIKTYFSGTGDTIKEDGGEIKDQIKEAIMGDPEETRITSLDKTKMYNFCVNWEATSKKLNNDVGRLNEGRDKLAKELGVYARDVENMLKDDTNKTENNDNAASANAAGNGNGANGGVSGGNGTNGASAGNSGAGNGASAGNGGANGGASGGNSASGNGGFTIKSADLASTNYSLLYNSFVTEDSIKPGKPIQKDTPSVSGSASGTSKSTIKTGTIDLDNKTAKNAITSYKGNENNEKLEEIKKMQENTSEYFTYLSNIIMGKLVAAQSMYKDYMQLLRMHVKDYAGEDVVSKDHTSDVAPAKRTINNQEYAFHYIPCDGVNFANTEYWIVGDVVLKVNGTPTPEIIEGLNAYQKAANFNAEARSVVKMIPKNQNSTMGLMYATFADGGWKNMEVITSNAEDIKAAASKAKQQAQANPKGKK